MVWLNAVGFGPSGVFYCSTFCHDSLAKKVVQLEHDGDNQHATAAIPGALKTLLGMFRSAASLMAFFTSV